MIDWQAFNIDLGRGAGRPTKTAVWVNDPEGWYEPEEIPERESEF